MSEPFLTLEPLIDALRDAIESCGWSLSGLQKTTSHQFEGRWEGESTRSAYLFFHRSDGPDFASVDVYLDETSRGLTGNVALVVDLAPLRRVGDTREVLAALAKLSAREIAEKQRRPLSLRYRLDDAASAPGDADTEVRFKVRLPRHLVRAGPADAFSWVVDVLGAFAEILRSPELAVLTEPEEPDPGQG